MPIYIHIANLIINKVEVKKKYAGGIDQFRLDYAINDEDNYNQEDNELFAIAKMNIDEFDLEKLVSKGLHFDEKIQFSTDFTLKPRYENYLWKTEWITDNSIFSWHVKANKCLIARVNSISSESMDSIHKRFEKGEKPFSSIV